MLRDFAYSPTQELIDTLHQFGFNSVDQESYIGILKFEVITPDSFMWRLLLDDGVYYMYAEDYIPSLSYINEVFNSYLKSDTWSFVKPAVIFDKLLSSAIKSGYDYVFLVKSSEDPRDAQFSAASAMTK